MQRTQQKRLGIRQRLCVPRAPRIPRTPNIRPMLGTPHVPRRSQRLRKTQSTSSDAQLLLTDIPDDVGVQILQLCDVRDACALAQVCRTTYRWSQDEYPWQQRFEARFPCNTAGPVSSSTLSTLSTSLISLPPSPPSFRQSYANAVRHQRTWMKGNYRTTRHLHTRGSGGSVHFDHKNVVSSARGVSVLDRTTFQTIRFLPGGPNSWLTADHIAITDVSYLPSSASESFLYDRTTMDVVFRARVKSIFARDIYVYERHLLVMSVHRLADIEEGAVQIWDVRSGQSVAELLRHDSVSPVLSRNKHDVSANCTRADGNYFVVGSNHQNVWLFDRRTWRCVASLGEGMFKDWVWCVDIDGGQVISGDNGRGVLMWDVNTLQCTMSMDTRVAHMVKCIKLDKHKFVAGCSGDKVLIGDRTERFTSNGPCLRTLNQKTAAWVRGVDFHDSTLMTSSDNGYITVYDFDE